MRWSPWVVTRAPPAPWLARTEPTTVRLSAFLDADAAGGEARGHQGDAVALLDPHLADAAHDGRALGEGRGDRQDRIFVDHRGRALGRHLDAGQLRMARGDVGDRLAALLADVG